MGPVAVGVERSGMLAVGVKPADVVVAAIPRLKVGMGPVHTGVEASDDAAHAGVVRIEHPHLRSADLRNVPFALGRAGPGDRGGTNRQRRSDGRVGANIEHIGTCGYGWSE